MSACDKCGKELTDLKVEFYLIPEDDYADTYRQTMLHPECFLAMTTQEVVDLHQEVMK